MKAIKNITEFRGISMTQRKKDMHYFMLKQIISEYERIDASSFNQFKRLKKIIFAKDRKDTPCPEYVGCCTATECSALWFDNINYDSIVMSMELAHFAIWDIYADMKVSNDLIHYAANVGREPYVKWVKVKYRTLQDAILKKPGVEIPIFIYNLPYLIKEKARIMNEVISNKAPKGSNPYWSGSNGGTNMHGLPKELLEYINHYHSHAHPWDHKH